MRAAKTLVQKYNTGGTNYPFGLKPGWPTPRSAGRNVSLLWINNTSMDYYIWFQCAKAYYKSKVFIFRFWCCVRITFIFNLKIWSLWMEADSRPVNPLHGVLFILETEQAKYYSFCLINLVTLLCFHNDIMHFGWVYSSCPLTRYGARAILNK